MTFTADHTFKHQNSLLQHVKCGFDGKH